MYSIYENKGYLKQIAMFLQIILAMSFIEKNIKYRWCFIDICVYY